MVTSTPTLGVGPGGAHGGLGAAPVTLSCCVALRSFFTVSCWVASGTEIPNFGAVVEPQAELSITSGFPPFGGIQLLPSTLKELPANETLVATPTDVMPPAGGGTMRRFTAISTPLVVPRYVPVAWTITRSLVSSVGPPPSAVSFVMVMVHSPSPAGTKPPGQVKGEAASSVSQSALSRRIRFASAIPASARLKAWRRRASPKAMETSVEDRLTKVIPSRVRTAAMRRVMTNTAPRSPRLHSPFLRFEWPMASLPRRPELRDSAIEYPRRP